MKISNSCNSLSRRSPLAEMIASQNMVAEAEVICQPNLPVLDVKYHLRVATTQEHNLPIDLVASPSSSSSISADMSRFDSVVNCSDTIKDAVIIEASAAKFVPNIRSGSYADIGPRISMDDEHIQIDDLSSYMGSLFRCHMPSAFYAVFDGHGGPDAATYIKKNAMRLFFEDADLPQTSDIDAIYLKELENSHRKAFLLADLALAKECSVSNSCGTTALTALILGRHLLVANAGDCRAVLCRKGQAVEMSQDHKPSYLPERKRVEELGGKINDGYLNDLSVTRALGDWDLKFPPGSASPLISEPDVQQVVLTADDEFLIIGCDGIWDVMSSQYAVSFVRRGLRKHDDPQQCARELVMEALRLNTSDNVTVLVICLSHPSREHTVESCPRRQRWRPSCLSEEARHRLKSLLEGN